MPRNPLICVVLPLILVGCTLAPTATVAERPGRTFAYDCNLGAVTVRYLDDGTAWLVMKVASVILAHKPAGSGAKYGGGGYTFWSKGDDATLVAPGFDEVECRLNRMASIWEGARMRGVVFRAAGNEPGWTMEIDPSGISVELDYGSRRIGFPGARLQPSPDEARLLGFAESSGARLAVQIDKEPCQDSMADQSYDARVTLQVNEKEYRGCGRFLEKPLPPQR